MYTLDLIENAINELAETSTHNASIDVEEYIESAIDDSFDATELVVLGKLQELIKNYRVNFEIVTTGKPWIENYSEELKKLNIVNLIVDTMYKATFNNSVCTLGEYTRSISLSEYIENAIDRTFFEEELEQLRKIQKIINNNKSELFIWVHASDPRVDKIMNEHL